MTIEELDEKLDQGLMVYQYYIAPNIRLKKKMVSPLRNERDPSFAVFRSNASGTYCFTDFGGDKGNHWTFVQRMFGCTFKEAVAKVKADILHIRPGEKFNPDAFVPVVQLKPLLPDEEPEVILTPIERAWTRDDFAFFARILVTKDELNTFHCIPCLGYHYQKGDKKFTVWDRPDDPIYAFVFPSGRVKIYRPFAKNRRFKWTSNLKASEDVFGLDSLPSHCDAVFLTAGNRDTMSFRATTGLWNIALSSESVNLTEEQYNILCDTCPSRKFYSLYDPDEGGSKGEAKLLEHWGIPPLSKKIAETKSNDFAHMVEENRQFLPEIRSFLHSLV